MLLPIEMGPKDGSEFLGYDSKNERFGICNYAKNGNGVDVLVKTHSEGVFMEETDFGYNVENITHCAPLPEKPPKIDYVSWYDGYEKTA